MTLQDLDAALRAVCPNTYELAAPAGENRYVVWHSYGASTLAADDSTVVDVPQVQIDIIYQDLADSIVNDVKKVLREQHLPYEVQADSYDDDYAKRRCILLIEVY